MHNARALKSFKGRLGSIGAGETFHCDPSYLEALKRNKLAESITPRDPGPSRDRSISSAPGKASSGNAPSAPTPAPASETGKGVTSLSAPAVQALRRQTSKALAVGAKKTAKKSKKKSKKTAGRSPAPGA